MRTVRWKAACQLRRGSSSRSGGGGNCIRSSSPCHDISIGLRSIVVPVRSCAKLWAAKHISDSRMHEPEGPTASWDAVASIMVVLMPSAVGLQLQLVSEKTEMHQAPKDLTSHLKSYWARPLPANLRPFKFNGLNKFISVEYGDCAITCIH